MNDFDTTTLRAETNPRFYSRFKWLSPLVLGWGLYSAYDGNIAYPIERDQSHAWFEVAKEQVSEEEFYEIVAGTHGPKEQYEALAEHLDDDETTTEAWEGLAKERDWPTARPPKLRTDGDIWYNHVMFAICMAFGGWMLAAWLRSIGRWIELADDVINTSWGQSFPLASVTQINKKQWRDKGIAKVKYTHDGRSGTFVVDDYKYHRKTTDEILRRIEQTAGVDKITAGVPEPEPSAVSAAGGAPVDAEAIAGDA